MAKLILRCNYFKNESARHRANYVKYLGTREGVEFDSEQLPRAFWDDADMHGKKENYVDYIAGRPGVIRVQGQKHGLTFCRQAQCQATDHCGKKNHISTPYVNAGFFT